MDNDLSYMCSTDSPPPPGYWGTIAPEHKDTKELVWVVCKYCRRYRSYLVTHRWLSGNDWEGIHCDCCGVELHFNHFTCVPISNYEDKKLDPIEVEHEDNVWQGRGEIEYDQMKRKLVRCVCGERPKIGQYDLVEHIDSDFSHPQLGVYCSCGLCTGSEEKKNFSDNLWIIQEAVKEWNKRTRGLKGSVRSALAWIQERAAVNDEYDDSEDE